MSEIQDAESVAGTEHAQAAQIVDLSAEGARLSNILLGVLLLLLFFAAFVFCLQQAVTTHGAATAGYGGAILAVVLLIGAGVLGVRRYQSDAAIMSLLSSDITLTEAIAQAGEKKVAQLLRRNPVFVRVLAQLLAKRGNAEGVLRIGAAHELRPVTPLNVRIEPAPLDETDRTVRTLLHNGDAPQPVAQTGASTALTPERSGRRLLQRLVQRAGGLVIVIPCFLSVAAVLAVWLRKGSISPMVFAAVGLGISILVGLVRSGSDMRWLVLNGGLLHRDSSGLRLFTRSNCALIVVKPLLQSTWRATLSDGVQEHELFMTPDELHFLLRAWTSPLPPLPMERMSDFAL